MMPNEPLKAVIKALKTALLVLILLWLLAVGFILSSVARVITHMESPRIKFEREQNRGHNVLLVDGKYHEDVKIEEPSKTLCFWVKDVVGEMKVTLKDKGTGEQIFSFRVIPGYDGEDETVKTFKSACTTPVELDKGEYSLVLESKPFGADIPSDTCKVYIENMEKQDESESSRTSSKVELR